MQVVILCGGFGTRMRDVTEDVPKPMVPIGDRPILWHIMAHYARHGFTRFVLCLGYKSWVIKRYFLDYHFAEADLTVRLGTPGAVTVHEPHGQDDWEVKLVETGLHTMTGGRVKAVARHLDGEHFLLTYGDGVSDIDVGELTAYHLRQGRVGTVTAVRVPGRFGELEMERGRVADFREKPVASPGWISGGFFVFRRDFLDRLPDDPSLVLEQQPLRELAHAGELSAYPHEGFWHCMDNSRDYQYLNSLWSAGEAPWARPPRARRLAA